MKNELLLSELLHQMDPQMNYKLIEEKPFQVLSLAVQKPGYSTCVFVDGSGFSDKLSSDVSMILTKESLLDEFSSTTAGICIVENPRETFFNLHNFLSEEGLLIREKYNTSIGENCIISELSSISKTNVTIGDNVLIEEFVTIRPNTIIGDNSIIRAGAVIGGHGYEFKRKGDVITSVAHEGGVIIGKNVEIQYNSCIDRGIYPWDDTVISDFTKIDNLVHVAHGVKIGTGVMVVANTGFGGRVDVGKNTWIGFATTIRNGISIGENARVNMGAVVTTDVKDNASVTGNFAIDHDKFIQKLKQNR